MAKNDRFVKTYEQAGFNKATEIWVDKETGVNYLFHFDTLSGGGLTVLLDKDGKPVVTPIDEK